MNIALPVLLLVFGGLTFWLLTESQLKWYFKTACIGAFCVFTVVFWTIIHTFLGWPAPEEDMPEIVLIHWVVVKEPDKLTKFKGAIYFLIESVEEENESFFGYKSSKLEPRLFGLPYSRKLHEQIEKQMMGKLKKGQPVIGRLTESKGEAGEKEEAGNEKSNSSESQGQEWEFHELRPSDLNKKHD